MANIDLLENLILKQRPGLVPRKVQVHPENTKSYWAIRWINPEKGFEAYETILSVDEKRALTNYKQFNSLLLNGFLRSGESQYKDFYNEEINLLDSSFKKIPPLENTEIVYRGFRNISFEDKIGDIFIDNGYVSTSLNPEVSKRFGKVVKIRIPQNSKVIPLDPLAPKDYRKEEEILLPRGSKFKVVKENNEIILDLLNE